MMPSRSDFEVHPVNPVILSKGYLRGFFASAVICVYQLAQLNFYPVEFENYSTGAALRTPFGDSTGASRFSQFSQHFSKVPLQLILQRQSLLRCISLWICMCSFETHRTASTSVAPSHVISLADPQAALTGWRQFFTGALFRGSSVTA
jgi:hypothetical protein